MPTYEYECAKCPRVFEVRQRITEPALETCDRCGGPIHRLLSAAPFILKGEGWYVTDYPSEARKKAASSESGGKESTSEAKPSEAKTSPKTPPKPSKDGGSADSKSTASSESKSSTATSASSTTSSAGSTS
jgi:putative FmdB family regulatory protein